MELPITQSNPINDEKSSKRSEVSSRRSMDPKTVPTDEGKRIFRGLGFNIISNHKFEYSFEHKVASRNWFLILLIIDEFFKIVIIVLYSLKIKI